MPHLGGSRLHQAPGSLRVWSVPALLFVLSLALIATAFPATQMLELSQRAFWSDFYAPEVSSDGALFRWTSTNSVVHLPTPPNGLNDVSIVLQSGRASTEAVPVVVHYAGQAVTIPVEQQQRTYHLLVPGAAPLQPPEFHLIAPTFQPPREIAPRNLGVIIRGVSVAPVGSAIPWWLIVGVPLLLQVFVLGGICRCFAVWKLRSLVLALWVPLQLPWLLTRHLPQTVALHAVLLLGLLGVALVVVRLGRMGALSPLRQRRVAEWGVFGLSAVVYVSVALFVPYPEGMNTTNGDEPHYLVLAYSLIYDHDFAPLNNYVLPVISQFYQGTTLTPAVYGFKGQAMPFHPRLGLPLVVAPAYALAGRAGVVVLLSILVALGMRWLYRAARSLVGAGVAGAGVVLCGLTYPLVIYSHQIYPDTIGFVIVAFVLAQILAPTADLRWRALGVGLALALLPHFHYKLALLSVTLYIWFLWTHRATVKCALAWSVGPIVAGVLLLALWFYTLYGELSLAILSIPTNQGSATASATMVARVLPGEGIFGLWFDQAQGLFFVAPLYVLVLVGVWAMWCNQRTREAAAWGLGVYLSYHVFVGSWQGWIGGSASVPRQIVPVLPLLVLFVTQAIAVLWARRQWVQVITLGWAQVFFTLLILNNRLLGYSFGRFSSPLFVDGLGWQGAKAWLPSFLNTTVGGSYGLLALYTIGFVGVWYGCWASNAILAAYLGDQGATSARRQSRRTLA